jgi:hypothetical protein
VRVLTVKQPWAWALIHGPKRVENRSWPTAYRGPLLIHAGKRPDVISPAIRALLPELPPAERLDYGAIVGVVDLVDCVPYVEVAGQPFAEGPWCWLVREPRPLTPLPCRGALSLWQPPADFRLPA